MDEFLITVGRPVCKWVDTFDKPDGTRDFFLNIVTGCGLHPWLTGIYVSLIGLRILLSIWNSFFR